MHFLSTIALGLACVSLAVADCCYKVDEYNCADGTAGTPCCGYGPCNIFCCNCDGGCRRASRSPLVMEQEPAAVSIFEQLDSGHKGYITISDYTAWVHERNPQTKTNSTLMDLWIDHFNKYDTKKDGKVTMDQIDTPVNA